MVICVVVKLAAPCPTKVAIGDFKNVCKLVLALSSFGANGDALAGAGPDLVTVVDRPRSLSEHCKRIRCNGLIRGGIKEYEGYTMHCSTGPDQQQVSRPIHRNRCGLSARKSADSQLLAS